MFNLSSVPRVSTRLAILAFLTVVAGCARIPEKVEVPPTQAMPAAESGKLYALGQTVASSFTEGNAAMLVTHNKDAMDIRLAMIDSAEVSLDLQYFVWSGDRSGNLILSHLLEAADRGVRVRLLIDDLYLLNDSGMKGPDVVLAAVDSHENIELKIFNAGKFRSGKMGIAGNFVGGFKEFNRRTHNKLMIADGQMGLVGGRNVADEYYGLREDYNFLDLDALVVGKVVPSMSEAYDVYWNSGPVYAAEALNPEATGDELAAVRDDLARLLEESSEWYASYPMARADWSEYLASLPARMHGTNATFLQDDPEVDGEENYRLYDMLAEWDKDDDREVFLVTPYLIPLDEGIAELQETRDLGIEVTILTASLSALDLPAPNAHYKKYRESIVMTGTHLYEFHHQPGKDMRKMADTAPRTAEFVAFHSKLSVTDGRTCYVGSLNLDPRAVIINTENGLVFESEGFCGELKELAELYIQPENSWHVTLDEEGELQWTSYEGTVDKQPARSGGQRMADFFFRIMPIEKIL